MLRTPFFYVTTVIAAIILIALAGCLGRSKPARFYTLTSISEGMITQKGDNQASKIAIGIGPIKLADYLVQSRIITRTSDNMIKQAEFDQWNGNLRDNLTNVLAENIGHLLGTGQIYIYPWRTYIPIDYQVIVDIVRLDGQPGKEVVLIARWSVLTGEENNLITTRRSDIREKTATNGYNAFVAAQSRALGRLSKDVVEVIHSAAKN